MTAPWFDAETVATLAVSLVAFIIVIVSGVLLLSDQAVGLVGMLLGALVLVTSPATVAMLVEWMEKR